MVGPRTRGYAIHKLGFCSVVMLGINSIIGAGIFLTPGEVIGLAGPFAPMAYVLAGIFAGVVAIVFATAARYVRTNGASYAYTTAAFGRRIGIYVGVTHAITASIAWGVGFFFRLDAVASGLPRQGLGRRRATVQCEDADVSRLYRRAVGHQPLRQPGDQVGQRNVNGRQGIRALGIHCRRAVDHHHPAREQLRNGVVGIQRPRTSLLGVAEIGKGTFSSMALATIVALYAFTGFESIANAAEEMDAPDRNLPRAIPIAIFSVGAIYLLTLTVAMLLGSNKIAASDDTVKLAAAIGNATFRTIIVVGALISMFGINVAASFGAPRLWTALADSGVLPTRLSRKNQYDVPMVSFAITASLALAFRWRCGSTTCT